MGEASQMRPRWSWVLQSEATIRANKGRKICLPDYSMQMHHRWLACERLRGLPKAMIANLTVSDIDISSHLA